MGMVVQINVKLKQIRTVLELDLILVQNVEMELKMGQKHVTMATLLILMDVQFSV